jgi:CDP-paratose 2-epimerase
LDIAGFEEEVVQMRVLVTGGCGFLGSHVCEYYAKRGDSVISLDSMTKYELERTGYMTDSAREYNWNYLEAIGIRLIKEDIRNAQALLDHSSGCDYIVHTAAQPAMTLSWEDPVNDFTTNVAGTLNVLEAARRHGIPVVSCATIHIYGNRINETLSQTDTRYTRTPASIDENHPTLEGTLSPLHASKMAGDIYVRTYADVYGVKSASFRLTGIYGPRQLGGEDHGWVANFSIRALLGWPLTIFGTGKQLRDILFVTDVASAFQAFYENQVPGFYNIGGGEPFSISLLECIDLIREICGKEVNLKFEPDRFGDLRYFICDIRKANKALGWSPKVAPREGVKRLIDWIEGNKGLFSLR